MEKPKKRVQLSNLKIQLNPDLVFQPLEDEVLLVNLQTNQIYELNPTGARFWELVNTDLELEQIQEQLSAEFDVDETQLAEEIQEMLIDMQHENLIQIQIR